MKRNLITLITAAVLIIIFALLLFTFQVRHSEVAVVTTFGKTTRRSARAGTAPALAVADSDKFINSTNAPRISRTSSAENLTADSITLLSSVYVGWRISDPAAFLQQFQERLRGRRPEPARKHPGQRQKRRGEQQYPRRLCQRGPETVEV